MNPGDLDYVGFYDKPLLKFERLLETYLAFAPRGFRSFAKAMPLWLGLKLHVGREIAGDSNASTGGDACSSSTTSRMPPARSSPRRSTRPPS